MSNLLKKRSFRRCMVATLSLMLFVSMVFGGVPGVGKAADVYADVNDRYVIAIDDGGDTFYEKCTLHEEDFDTDGNLTIEFRGADENNYNLFYQIDGKGKPYINSNSFELTDSYFYLTYFIINRERCVKCDYNAKVLTVNKSDFKKKQDGFYEMTVGTADTFTNNQWYLGIWFDENGENTYAPLGSWKGSGNSQWFEDTSGWYPVSQWMQTNKYYESFNAYAYKSEAAQMSGGWSDDNMNVSRAWFYFDSNGYAVHDGWYQIDGYWYYFDNFLYEAGCWRDGYYIGYDGTQTYEYTGSWKSDGTGWWFEDTSGWYPSNHNQIIDGKVYYFRADGYLATDQWLAPGTDGNPGEAGNTWSDWIHVDSSGLIDKYGEYDENGNWSEHGDWREYQ